MTRGGTILICTALLAGFAALAWGAVRGNSPTADEPYHALAAYLHRWDGDYRFDAEDPPLWQRYAALTTPRNAIHSDFQQQDWTGVPMNTPPEFQWILRTMYRTPGNDPGAFLARQRAMMLLIGVTLGATIAGCAYRWSPSHKPVAAVIAATLFCLDPNFLAHSPLMKNDVVISLAMLGIIVAVRAVGRRLTPWNVIHLGLWCGVAVSVKFTGLLLVGIAAVLLLTRALLPAEWPTPAGVWRRWPERLVVASVAILLTAAVAFTLLWASYGFRFAPGADPHFSMDFATAVHRCQLRSWQAAHTDGVNLPDPDVATVAAAPVPLAARVAVTLNTHRLLPQAWLAGFLYTYQSALIRGEFLLGRLGCAGWWWYFPFAILVKTPLATLAALGLTVASGRLSFRERVRVISNGEHAPSAESLSAPAPAPWTTLCLLLPILIYLLAAMRTNLNLGLRHVFPIYPPLFIAVGLTTARCWSRRVAILSALLAAGLAAETLLAYPHFIPFFNAAAGGWRGGLRLLSDSNLDWGQDLTLLAAWHRAHPDTKLYLAYFGQADPSYYGIPWTNLDPTSPLGPVVPPTTPGVLAISATALQGPYLPQIDHRPYFASLYAYRPLTILGGSIYLFPYPLHPADRLPAGQSLIRP